MEQIFRLHHEKVMVLLNICSNHFQLGNGKLNISVFLWMFSVGVYKLILC